MLTSVPLDSKSVIQCTQSSAASPFLLLCTNADSPFTVCVQVTAQGRPIKDGDITVWARQLEGGDVAVALYNQEDAVQHIGVAFADVGLSSSVAVRDLWSHTDLGNFETEFPKIAVEPHATVMLKLVNNKA